MESVKIVVRFPDGRILKGHSQDFFPNKPAFHLVRNLARGSGNQKEIRVSDLKAIFFVKTFAGNPDYKERKSFVEGDVVQGRKVEVAFVVERRLACKLRDYELRLLPFASSPF